MELKQIVISDDDLVSICKYRQDQCCKYIIFMEKVNQFCCVKNVPELRSMIDSQVDMKAIGDNCEGIQCDETDL